MKIKRNITLWIGLSMLLFLIFIMFVGPHLPFIDPELKPESYRVDENKKIILPPYKPSPQNLIGSDKQGVDNLSKLIIGAKETILLVFTIVLIRYIMAVPLGLLAYKRRGPAHWLITGMNQLFSSLPTIFAAVLLLSLPMILNAKNRIYWVILLLAIIEVGRVAYIVQQRTHNISKEHFVEAGTVLGISPRGFYTRYYFPSLLPEIVVNFCIDLGKVMLLLGQLGVLSIFISQTWIQLDYGNVRFLNTSNNWGTLIATHRRDIVMNNFSFIFYPALFITFAIFTFNIMGEGLRRHFNRHISY